jgi:hypothetical protein
MALDDGEGQMLSFRPFTCAFVASAMLSTASLACNSWDFGSSLKLSQDNGPVVTVSKITQERRDQGQYFEGNAKYSGGAGRAKGMLEWDGRFSLDIFWQDGTVGRYTAHVDQLGAVLDGTTQDQTHPQSWSRWHMSQRIACKA